MAAYFAHKRGSVHRVTSQAHAAGGLLPFRIIVSGMSLAAPGTQAIITQAGIIENGNYQFLHTLNETIYAYVFGDRIGELRIGGMCFAHPCNGGSSGMKQVIDSYRANRIAKLGGPVQVSFGEKDYRAFLVGMTLDISDSERVLGQWALRFNTFPGAD